MKVYRVMYNHRTKNKEPFSIHKCFIYINMKRSINAAKNSEEGVPGGSPYELFHLRNFKRIMKSEKLASLNWLFC